MTHHQSLIAKLSTRLLEQRLSSLQTDMRINSVHDPEWDIAQSKVNDIAAELHNRAELKRKAL